MAKQYWKFKKQSLYYLLVNYLDKSLIFIIPIFLLKISQDEILYNKFEYVYSLSSVLVIILTLPIKSYLFYGYKISSDRNDFLILTKSIFITLLIAYCISGILIGLTNGYLNNSSISYFVLIRMLFLFVTQTYAVYALLEDRPKKTVLYTIVANGCTILLISVLFFFQHLSIEYLFLSQLIIVCCFIFYNRPCFNFALLKTFFKNSISYSWPGFISVLLFAFVNNFAKIYSFEHLSSFDMFKISAIQRSCMIIIITHGALLSFFTKSIYIQGDGFNINLFLRYSLGLLVGCIGSLFLILLFDEYLSPYKNKSIFDIEFFKMLAFTVLWCISSYLELYYNRIKKNKQLLLNSVIASIVYLILVYFWNANLKELIFAMIAYAIVYLSLNIFILKKIKLKLDL